MAKVKFGAIIPLTLQLEGAATDKFPQADLTDAAGAALPASPVDLAHVSGGLYSNNAVLMPSTAYVKAVYKSFEEIGHTTPSPDYVVGSAAERFDRDVSSPSDGTSLKAALKSGKLTARLKRSQS